MTNLQAALIRIKALQSELEILMKELKECVFQINCRKSVGQSVINLRFIKRRLRSQIRYNKRKIDHLCKQYNIVLK